MEITIRSATEADAQACGRICYEGFRAVTDRHGYPPVFASIEVATRRLAAFLANPSVFGLVAELAGKPRIAGFNFLSERDPIRAIGPIAVDPSLHGYGIGRRLMQAALDRARGAPSVRLVQESYNIQSLSLYTSLGFGVREVYAVVTGTPAPAALSLDWEIRPLRDGDIPACEALQQRVVGYSRMNELRETLAIGAPLAALRDGGLRAYASVPTSWQANHAMAETDEDLQALLLGAARIRPDPLALLIPVRRAELFRWCLAQGLRAVRPMTLMSVGQYREPQGAYVPSVLY
ncbi:MAG: GNAT family N-acetyltransferase [Xanthobacteraceae bacterium]|nr:GNAT family N-acetyltransferase [Xanthobacteraceae bacterium]